MIKNKELSTGKKVPEDRAQLARTFLKTQSFFSLAAEILAKNKQQAKYKRNAGPKRPKSR